MNWRCWILRHRHRQMTVMQTYRPNLYYGKRCHRCNLVIMKRGF